MIVTIHLYLVQMLSGALRVQGRLYLFKPTVVINLFLSFYKTSEMIWNILSLSKTRFYVIGFVTVFVE